MLFDVLCFAVGVIVAAFSHKWLAAMFTEHTGLDPQAVADQAAQAVQQATSKKP